MTSLISSNLAEREFTFKLPIITLLTFNNLNLRRSPKALSWSLLKEFRESRDSVMSLQCSWAEFLKQLVSLQASSFHKTNLFIKLI